MIDMGDGNLEELVLVPGGRAGGAPRPLTAEGGAAVGHGSPHRDRLAGEMEALRGEVRRLAELLRARVQPQDGEWLDAGMAAARMSLTRRALYSAIARDPSGPLGQAASRLGRRLRFSKSGIDALLARREAPLRPRTAPGSIRMRASSPVKSGDGRWP